MAEQKLEFYIANVYAKHMQLKYEFKALTLEKLKQLINNKMAKDKENFDKIKIFKAVEYINTNVEEFLK